MSRDALSHLLVSLQFGLLAVLGWAAAPTVIAARTPAAAWALLACGALLGIWALSSNRPGNFNVRPIPRAEGVLVQSGPYRWIRHPMYTAVILSGLACAWAGRSTSGWVGVACLVAVLAVKAHFEEQWMQAKHPHYAAYRTRTWRFIPWLV